MERFLSMKKGVPKVFSGEKKEGAIFKQSSSFKAHFVC